MMNEVLLTSICRPKQWKTISSSDLHEIGYPVYGANGKIGFYNTYTHEHPTVLITCRGATCGTINICEPKSYVNGNAMALDNLSSNVDMYYLKHYLEYRKLDDVISGSAQPQITGQGLSKVKIPLPPLPQQQKIANILDAADALKQNDKALIAKYDELTQALFLDMFGDPVSNPMGWEKFEFSKVAKNENSKRVPVKQSDRDKREGEYPYYGATGIIDTIDDYKFDGEFLLIAEDGKNLLFRKKNNAFIAKGKFWVNNHAHVLSPNGVTDMRYLEFFLNSIDFGPYISGIDQIKLNKESLNKIPVPVPPINLQNQFAERVAVIEEQKAIAQKSLEHSESLFNSLLQKAFKGELV
jgi:type I restriction enzyme S subunit